MLSAVKTDKQISILKLILLTTFVGLFAFIFVPYIVLQAANAEEVNVNIMIDDMSLSLDTGSQEGNVDFGNINTNDDGTLLMARKDITVDTTARYYMVYLSSASNSIDLTNEFASTKISAIGSSFSVPAAFSTSSDDTDNTWGYALTEYTTAAGSTSVAKDTSFAQGKLYYIDNSGTEIGSNGYDFWSAQDPSRATDPHWNTTWAPLAERTTAQKIYYDSTTYPAGFASNTAEGKGWVDECKGDRTPENSACNSMGPAKFSVYYGAKVNNGLLMGEYKNTVLYTAIASLQDISGDKAQLAIMSRDSGGVNEELKLNIEMNASPILDTKDVKVYFVDHNKYQTNFGAYGTDVIISDTKLYTVGAECPVSDISINPNNNAVAVTCKTPLLGTTLGSPDSSTNDGVIRGAYDTDALGIRNSYDIIVSIPGYNLKFTTRTRESQKGYSYNVMQEMTADICDSIPMWESASDDLHFADVRDNKNYVIRKLADGNCWMVQNLDLDLTTNMTLSSNDSDISVGRTWTPASLSDAWKSAHPVAEADKAARGDYVITQREDKNEYGENYLWAQTGSDGAHVMDFGPEYYIDKTAGPVETPDTVPVGTANTMMAGNWYNWYAATAGTGTANVASGNASDSICPKGWQLPELEGDKSYDNLIRTVYNISDTKTDANLLASEALSIVRSGYYHYSSGSLYNRGSEGLFWGSRAHSATNAYYLNFGSSNLDPQHSYVKGNGFAVRCVAKTEKNPFDAVFAAAGATKQNGVYKMQDMTASICNAVPTPSTTEVFSTVLVDVRDNKNYVVRKLADGNCWMAQNLDLDLTTNMALTSADSDISIGRTWRPSSLSDAWISAHPVPDADKSTRGDYVITQIEDKNEYGGNYLWSQTSSDGAHVFDQGSRYYSSPTAFVDDTSVYPAGTANTYMAGNWYNWYAATAGTGTANVTSGDASDSICPKGWQLPTYSGTKSYNNLIRAAYGLSETNTDANLLALEAPSFIRSGYYNYSSGARNNSGSLSYFWGSRADSGTYANRLGFSSSGLDPQGGGNRGNGFAVRCVAKDDDNPFDAAFAAAGATKQDGVYKMQDMTSSVCNAVPAASKTDIISTELVDTRDGKHYTVRKLADGNCWMTQNLDLDLTTNMTLTPADSDISEGRTWTPSSLSDAWIAAHPVAEADKATRGDYIITQIEDNKEYGQSDNDPSKDFRWADNGSDGAHVMDLGPEYYASKTDSMPIENPSLVPLGSANTMMQGNWYNWYAATAGTGTADTAGDVDVPDSICPKGWQLPTYSGTKSYNNLIRTAYGLSENNSDANFLALEAPAFVRSGYYSFSNGTLSNRNSSGHFWESSASSVTDVYSLYFGPLNLQPRDSYGNKGLGFAVRCVAK